MKRQLLCVLGMVVLGACSKPVSSCEPRKDIQSDSLHIELGSGSVILYPSGIPVRVACRISGQADSIRMSAAAGVCAVMDADSITLSGSAAMPGKSLLQVRAFRGGSSAAAEMALERAHIDVDRASFAVGASGAELSAEVASNLPLSYSCDSSWLSWTAGAGLKLKVAKNFGFGERRAALWIREPKALLDTFIMVSQAGATNYEKLERDALVALFKATGGASWKQVSSTVGGREWSTRNWCTDRPICEWYGIETNSDGLVVYIHLNGMGLSGTLPEELGDLLFCQELNLASNNLSGGLPTRIGEMKSLRSFSAGGNGLSGVLEESALSKLASGMKLISLQGNDFTGRFPEWIGDMPAECNFWLQQNRLSGEVPEKVRQHPRWNAVVMDGTGRTVGEINSEQKEREDQTAARHSRL